MSAAAQAATLDAVPPLLKIAALLTTGWSVHRSLSPPNPPPAPKTCIDKRTLFERAIRHVTFCSKVRACVSLCPCVRACVRCRSPPGRFCRATGDGGLKL